MPQFTLIAFDLATNYFLGTTKTEEIHLQVWCQGAVNS